MNAYMNEFVYVLASIYRPEATANFHILLRWQLKLLINLFCPALALSRWRCLFARQSLNKCFCPDHKWFICYLCVPCWTSDGSFLRRHNQSSQTTLFNVKVNTPSQPHHSVDGALKKVF